MSVDVLPSSALVRARIEAIPDGVIRGKTSPGAGHGFEADGRRVRMGFMFNHLVAGRLVEAFGKYMPTRDHAIKMNVKLFDPRQADADVEKAPSEPAVLFLVKTAKRHNEKGWTIRPVMVPLNPVYEPWAEAVADYMKDSQDEYPFMLADTVRQTYRIAQAIARDAFDGLRWRYKEYTNPSVYIHPEFGPFPPRPRKDGKPSTLVQIPYGVYQSALREGKATMTEVPGYLKGAIDVPARWKDARSHKLCRARRMSDLRYYYRLSKAQRNVYAGWEGKGDDEGGESEKFYTEMEIDQSTDEGIITYTNMARDYFPKLLKPYAGLLNPLDSGVTGIEIIR